MNQKLTNLLRVLEDSLILEKQQITEREYIKVLNWEPVVRLPLIITYPYPESYSDNPKPFPHEEVFDDPEKMLFNELVHSFDTSILLNPVVNDDLPFTIRANFGTVIIASLFGGRVEYRGNNPPWVRNFDNLEDFRTIFDRDPDDFTQGICPRITDRYKFYQDILIEFPNVSNCIKIVLPDLQGPLDSLELLRGSQLYEDFILQPEMVEKGLGLMAQAQVGFAKHLQQFIKEDVGCYSHQHATTVKGNILIRNDSAILISPEMYSEQVAHHDEFVLSEMGGGGIHSCGKIDFNIAEIFRLPSIKCFDFGQSHLNDIDLVYSMAKERKIPLIRIRVEKDQLLSGEVKERFPTGVSLVYEAGSIEEAKSIAESYRNSVN